MYIGYLIGGGRLEWVDCPGCGQTSLLFAPGTVPGMNGMSVHSEGCPVQRGLQPRIEEVSEGSYDEQSEEYADGQGWYQLETDADDLESGACVAGTDF